MKNCINIIIIFFFKPTINKCINKKTKQNIIKLISIPLLSILDMLFSLFKYKKLIMKKVNIKKI